MDHCEVCGHVYGQRHRIKPGEWGGEHEPGNIAWLCPNHHAAIHLLMKWSLEPDNFRETEKRRLTVHLTPGADPLLMAFWKTKVLPVVEGWLAGQGKKPHPMQLPTPAEQKPTPKRREKLLYALVDSGKEGLSLTQISGVFHRAVSSNVIRLLLEQLVEEGLVLRGKIASAGRPAIKWKPTENCFRLVSQRSQTEQNTQPSIP